MTATKTRLYPKVVTPLILLCALGGGGIHAHTHRYIWVGQHSASLYKDNFYQ